MVYWNELDSTFAVNEKDVSLISIDVENSEIKNSDLLYFKVRELVIAYVTDRTVILYEDLKGPNFGSEFS